MQLSNATYKKLANKIHIPLYDRSQLKPAIVHIGLGHFHRSHFCYYLHTLLQQGITNWGIEEVDLIATTTKERAEKQDYLFTLCSKDPQGSEEACIIGCILGYTEGWKYPERVSELIAREETKLVTLTITEKGYCYDAENHSLDWKHPAIVHDLAHPTTPQSAVGHLALALRIRKDPLTIASCDNMPSNGAVLRICLYQYCQRVFPEVLPFLEQSVSFPLSMVDRITPNTTKADTAHIADTYGYEDTWSVVSEDFLQWVIEPKGLEGLPDFSKAGVIITDQVESYEVMKIRLLNGSHSALAYPAYLLGYSQVAEAMCDEHLRKFIREWYMDEVGKSVPSIEGFDQEAYKDQLIARFQNPSIKDTLLRLAQDGSKKFTNALTPALLFALRNQLPLGSMVLALSFWICFLETVDPSLIDDGQKHELLVAARVIESDTKRFFSLIGLSAEQGSMLRNPLLACLEYIHHDGVLAGFSTRT
ncbi:mannitol dehydrogenase family protein [uncultured Sphaerochaeta sp.]|uniref:mannitol dehydrogenase family protein n=1 Tax=uncultured Sphaerochaeta sp. TaxID=886478 RepID=UPI002A0A70E4|nr:mannitol dehydrogenase family protein [uncultured Sphaerochaeta sp.]